MPLLRAVIASVALSVSAAGAQTAEGVEPRRALDFGGAAERQAAQAAQTATLAAVTAQQLGLDFDAILVRCQENTASCAETLHRSLAAVLSVGGELPDAALEQLLGSLATVAVATAQQAPAAAGPLAAGPEKDRTSETLGAFLRTLAQAAPERSRDPLMEAAGNVASGNAAETVLAAVAASPG